MKWIVGAVAAVLVMGCAGDASHKSADTLTAMRVDTPHATEVPASPQGTSAADEAHRVGLVVPEEVSDMAAPVMEFRGAREVPDARGRLTVMHVWTVERREEVWLLAHADDTPGAVAPGWKVIASLLPIDSATALRARTMLGCRHDGRADPRLVVVAQWEDLAELTHILRAWRVDSTRTFARADTTNISCHTDVSPV